MEGKENELEKPQVEKCKREKGTQGVDGLLGRILELEQ